MPDTQPAQRPQLQQQDTLDAPQLIGKLGRNSIAELQPNSAPSSFNPSSKENDQPDTPQQNGVGFQDFASRSKSDSAATSVDSDDAIEDYDELQLDPDTLIANTRASLDEAHKFESKDGNGNGTSRGSGVAKANRRRSIQIKLQKTDRKGQYTLTADDPEISDILQKGIEREKREAKDKSRTRFRDLVFTRQFTTFDRQNPASSESPFFGFFTLFWLSMVIIFVQVSMHNWRTYGSILGSNQVMKLMFSRDVFILGLTDGVMCAATVEAFLLSKLVQKGYVNWAKHGWIIQNIWQSFYLATVIWWTWFREWPWTHSIFVFLHCLVFIMKQHSYTFYNGYLSGVRRRREVLQLKLKQLEHTEPASAATPTNTEASPLLGAPNGSPKDRRPSAHRTSTNLVSEKSDVATVAAAIESGRPFDLAQLQAFESVIKSEISDLNEQLEGKMPNPERTNTYPRNLRLGNFAEFICLPTLVYELDYPRQERTNWWYVAEKTAATFGVLCVMMVISQGFIYPAVARTVEMKEAGMPLEERWKEFPFIVSEMLFPLLIEQLLTWYVIWECILNVLAEVTRFADRGFYGDWWNSVSWDQYARDWNRPVHNFLLRHVYHSSISTFHLSRNAATFVTFLLSALVHELTMAILFKKVRPYLFTMQLLQMPLVSLSRTKLLKGRTVLGNVIFWIGLFIGPSFITSLYLII
jgi:sterol O-acyltransferase